MTFAGFASEADTADVKVDGLVEEDVAAPLARRVAKVALDLALLDGED